jgi:hypothetical protein
MVDGLWIGAGSAEKNRRSAIIPKFFIVQFARHGDDFFKVQKQVLGKSSLSILQKIISFF